MLSRGESGALTLYSMKILYFAPIPYDGLKQRPQYLAEELAKEYDVIYIEPTISWMKHLIKGGRGPRGTSYEVNPRLKVIRLNGTFSLHRSFECFCGALCIPERIQLKKLFQEADMVWTGYAPWYDVVRKYKGALIYDKMDEDAELTRNPLIARLSKRLESQLIDRADLIFVTAQKFAIQMKKRGRTAVILPNAVDAKQLKRSTSVDLKRDAEEKVFGYVGMISHWFDWDAIRTILITSQQNRVVLVGPTETPIPNWDRLNCTGQIPKEDVGDWIAAFDVCLYPFKQIPLIETINPVKIYEYLAENKPVIAVDSTEIRRFGNLVYRYADRTELSILATKELANPFPNAALCKEFVAANSWEERGRGVRAAIKTMIKGS